MSQPDSTDTENPKRFDIYSVMLAVALVCLIISIALLAMEMGRYGWDYKATTAPRAQLQPPVGTMHAHLDVTKDGLAS